MAVAAGAWRLGRPAAGIAAPGRGGRRRAGCAAWPRPCRRRRLSTGTRVGSRRYAATSETIHVPRHAGGRGCIRGRPTAGWKPRRRPVTRSAPPCVRLSCSLARGPLSVPPPHGRCCRACWVLARGWPPCCCWCFWSLSGMFQTTCGRRLWSWGWRCRVAGARRRAHRPTARSGSQCATALGFRRPDPGDGGAVRYPIRSFDAAGSCYAGVGRRGRLHPGPDPILRFLSGLKDGPGTCLY